MMGPCPSPTALEEFAEGAIADHGVEAHVGVCPVCRAVVEDARENNRFLDSARSALVDPYPHRPADDDSRQTDPGLVSEYQIQQEIHRGGQGVVYRAVQTRTRRTVAIKVLLGGRGATQRQKERFEREVRIAAGLRHPNIVTVHDSGPLGDGRYGLVMEYIEGVTLDRWSRSLDETPGRDARRGALRRRLAVLAKVCDAVVCAHQHSIVHRDLKPANILVDSAAEPHILDFGIARDTRPDQHTRLTHTGEFAGTLAYASPEQVSGDPSRVDSRTDIYSLGVIMYEVLSGKMPYAVDGPMSRVIRSIELAEPTPLRRFARDPAARWVDGEVSTIVLKAMAKDPARRYQTAAELRDDVGRYLSGDPIEARRDSTWYVLRKTAARHRIAAVAAALIFVLLAAFGGAMAYQAHHLEVRGRELSAALSDSTIERGRMLAAAGDIPLAEEIVWPELIGAGVTRIDGLEDAFAGSPQALRAFWALWDTYRRSSCVATLRTQGKEIQLLYFGEGGRLCSLDNEGTLTTWSVAGWEPVRAAPLVARSPDVTLQAALAPNGSIGIFGGGMLRVIDPEDGRVSAQAHDPGNQAVTGAFSPDGSRLATLGLDNRLRVRNTSSLETIVTMAGSAVCEAHPWFCRPTFSLDGRLVAAARPGGSVGLWNASSGVLERTLALPASMSRDVPGGLTARSIAFGSSGAIAAAMGFHLVVWPADGGTPLDLGAPFAHMRDVAFFSGSSGELLVSCGNTPGGGGGAAIIWDPATGKRMATFKLADEMARCAASPDATLIAVGCEFGAVCVFDATPEPHVAVLRSGAGGGSNVALSPDGRIVAMVNAPAGLEETDVVLFDRVTGVETSRIQGAAPLAGLAFDPSGTTIFGCEESGRVVQWDVPAGTVRREFIFSDPGGRRTPDGSPNYKMWGFNQMRLSADGRTLARSRDDGLIGLWDAHSGRWIDWLDSGSDQPATIDFSPDGETLVAHHSERCILWDVRARRPTRTITTPKGYPVVRFSHDGTVVAHSVLGCIQFVDAKTGRITSQNNDPRSCGLGSAFHPDGPVLAASAFDSSVRLWDVRTGRELLSLQKHSSLIRSVILTPDGRTLISSDVSGLVLAWDLAYYNERLARELEYRSMQSRGR